MFDMLPYPLINILVHYFTFLAFIMVLPASVVLSSLDMAVVNSKNAAYSNPDVAKMHNESKMFEQKTILQKEKQISVDPVSLKESASIDMAPKSNLLLPLQPANPRFLSTSLPNSGASSPRFSSNILKKKWKNQSQATSFSTTSLARQHSVALANLERLRQSHLRRSKSYCEGRSSAASDDIVVWFNRRNNSIGHESSPPKSDLKNEVVMSVDKEAKDTHDEEFKCGALCLFLPGFGKGKPVKARKEAADHVGPVVSRTVSLEKFECGSWTSSAIMNDNEEEDNSTNLYFDLPLELIRSNANDTDSPVRAAFFFDKDRKGVLKSSSSRGAARKSHELPRHVRFSASSPRSYPTSPASCITPRLRKAREDFNAFLEAQSA